MMMGLSNIMPTHCVYVLCGKRKTWWCFVYNSNKDDIFRWKNFTWTAYTGDPVTYEVEYIWSA